MDIIRLKLPASVATLILAREEPSQPDAGEVLIRLRATSLNPHDDFVARGIIPASDGRVPLSDGAGEVVACGEGVTDLRVGDAVVSTFWPYWSGGDTAVRRRYRVARTRHAGTREARRHRIDDRLRCRVVVRAAVCEGRGCTCDRHVIEVGGPATIAQSMSACRLGGHIAVIGLLSGVMAEINIPALFSAQMRVGGISIGSRADQEDMIRAIEVNRIAPVIDRSFALGEIQAAFEYFQTQSHFGKVCIDTWR